MRALKQTVNLVIDNLIVFIGQKLCGPCAYVSISVLYVICLLFFEAYFRTNL